MSKPVINNKILYSNIFGRVAQHDIFVNQGVSTGDSPTFNDIYIMGDASITGNLYVEGNTTILNTNILEFEDNIILLNRAETGNGVTLNQSGLEIERGSLENYRVVFNESDNTFRVGPVSNTQAVATRENTPLNNGVMTWNNTNKRLDSTDNIKIDLSLTSSTNSTSVSSGTLTISGGLGVNKDIYTNGKINICGSNNNNVSSLWTDNSSNVFNISSVDGINISPNTKVSLPYDKPLVFGSDNHAIVVNSLNNNMKIESGNDINFNLGFGKKITIPNGIPITFSTQNEKVYADNSNNMVIEGSQDINLIPGTNKRVLLGFDTPLAFGNSNVKMYGTLIEDLYIQSGNNIVLSPSSTKNVVIPTDSGIRFGNSGYQQIYSDSNSKLFINSSNDIEINVSSNNILLTGSTKLSFGNNNQYIFGETLSNSLIFNANSIKSSSSSFINVQNTTNSTNPNSGAIVINGGVGINKNLNVGGNVTITGDLTVSGVTTTINTETVLISDNILVVNSGPSPVSDGGLLIKKFQSGSSGSVDYAGIFYKNTDNRIVFANTLSDPGKTTIQIDKYLPISANDLILTSSTNAIGLGSGGGLTISGGCSIFRDMYMGGTIYLKNTDNMTTTLNMNNNFNIISDESIIINSNKSMVIDSQFGDFRFTSSNDTLLSISSNGNVIFTGSQNAVGLGTGGNLTVNGGCSIKKDVFIGGVIVCNNTTNSSNLTTASLVVNGGISVANDTNSTYGNGGSLSIGGGVYIEKDLYLSGNIYSNNSINELFSLKLTSTEPSSFVTNGGVIIKNSSNSTNLTDGGSLLVYGGGSVNRDFMIGGDLYAHSSVYINNGLSIAEDSYYYSINNKSSSSDLWTYVGKLNTYYKLNLISTNLVFKVDLLIQNTTPNFSYSLSGNIASHNNPILSVYKDNMDNYHVFIKTPAENIVNLQFLSKDQQQLSLNNEGYDLLPNGSTSNFDGSWTKTWSTDENTSSLHYRIGDITVSGNMSVFDNAPIIGSQQYSFNKINERDLGLLFQRYQESNNTSDGDIILDDIVYNDVLPSQSTANTTQIIFSNTANSTNDYYLGWWIKTADNQVRKITSYNGTLRVAQIDIPWVTQPTLGDTISFYNKQFPGLYWDEGSKMFSLSYLSKNTQTNLLLNNGNATLRCDRLLLTNTTTSFNNSSGSIFTLGGVNIQNSTDATDCSNGGSFTTIGGVGVGKSVCIGEKLYIGPQSTDANNSFTINHTTSSISLFNAPASYSCLSFFGDSTSSYHITNDNSDDLFSISYTTTNNGPKESDKSFVITNTGNIGIQTTTINSLLTIRGENFITSDNETTFLGICGSSNTDGSRVILHGNNSINNGDVGLYSGGTLGSLKMYTNNAERIVVDNSGNVNILTSTNSFNSSSGALVVNGGIAIISSENATSSSNGGSFTTNGGLSVKRDVYIGGDVYITGKINSTQGVLSPVVNVTNTQNCSIISVENSSLIMINDQILYTVSIVLNPIESSNITAFEFGLPERGNNFIKLNDINIQCNGFTGDETTLFNVTGLAVTGTTRCKIKFQSASTGVHYIQILSRYNH